MSKETDFEEYRRARTTVQNDLKNLMHIYERTISHDALALILMEFAVTAAHYFRKPEEALHEVVRSIYKEKKL